jgi:hypothetical protein
MRWNSDKDSTFALDAARDKAAADVVGLVVTFNGHADRVAMHGYDESSSSPKPNVSVCHCTPSNSPRRAPIRCKSNDGFGGGHCTGNKREPHGVRRLVPR